MSKIRVALYLLPFLPVVAQAMTCHVQAVRREVDPATKSWKGPASAVTCEMKGAALAANPTTGESIVELDFINGKTEIKCDFSMNGFIEIKTPLVTLAITDKSGKPLDVQTGSLDSGLHAIYLPIVENAMESMALRCWK